MSEIEILQKQVSALQELVKIQEQVITQLKTYPKPYYWGNYYPYQQWYGFQGIGGTTQTGNSGNWLVTNTSGNLQNTTACDNVTTINGKL